MHDNLKCKFTSKTGKFTSNTGKSVNIHMVKHIIVPTNALKYKLYSH